ncbi:MAG: BrnA antitoxin family protein [Desulfovibrio sp.]|jgi:uncharacterized protein (DUF4415 family)|nr:BrnA antitoxin family protein [Desulfovibrio sp.]
MNKNGIPPLEEQIANLKQKDDKDIDLSDIPEILDWTGAIRGKFYRPLKRQVSMRLDADIVAWFKNKYPKYQTAINSVLRQYVHTQS